MNCGWTLNNSGSQLLYATVDQLLNDQVKNEKRSSGRFLFFHSNVSGIDIANTVQTILQNGGQTDAMYNSLNSEESVAHVTNFVLEHVGYNIPLDQDKDIEKAVAQKDRTAHGQIYWDSNSTDEERKSYFDKHLYNADLGTLLSDCITMPDEMFDDYFEKFSTWARNIGNATFNAETSSFKFVKSEDIPFLKRAIQPGEILIIREQLLETRRKLQNKFPSSDWIYYPEKKLAYNGDSKIIGRADLILVNKTTGEVVIIDVKTRRSNANVLIGTNTNAFKIALWAGQTAMYKEMLQNSVGTNIPLQTSTYIFLLLCGENGIELTDNNGDFLFDPMLRLSGSALKSRVNAALNLAFGEAKEFNDRNDKLNAKFSRYIKYIHTSRVINLRSFEFFADNIKFYIEKEKPYKSKRDKKDYILRRNLDDPESINICRIGQYEVLKTIKIDDFIKAEFDGNYENMLYVALGLSSIFKNGGTSFTKKSELINVLNDRIVREEIKLRFYYNLMKYCSSQFVLVNGEGDIPNNFLFDQNILVFKNLFDQTYDFVILSDLYALESKEHINLTYNQDVLGDVLGEELDKYKKHRNAYGTKGNIEKLRALAAIGMFLNTQQEPIKLGFVTAISLNDGTKSDSFNYSDLLYSFKILGLELSEDNEESKFIKDTSNEIYLNLTTKVSNIPLVQKLTRDLLTALSGTSSDLSPVLQLSGIIDFYLEFIDASLLLKINIIEQFKRSIKENFYNLFLEKPNKDNFNAEATSEEEEIKNLYLRLEQLLAVLKKFGETQIDLIDSGIGVSPGEMISHGWQLLTKGRAPKYNKNGMLSTSVFLALQGATTYSDPQELTRILSLHIEAGYTKLANQYKKIIDELNKATAKYIEPVSGIVRYTAGTRSMYTPLFVHDRNGNIDKNWLFYNPYDLSNPLTAPQREYLEVVLWVFNKLRIRHHDEFTVDIRELTYELLKANQEVFDKYKEILKTEPIYLQAPVRGSDEGFVRYIRAIANSDDKWDTIKKLGEFKWNNLKNLVSRSGITSKYVKLREAKFELLRPINPYDEGDWENRSEKLEAYNSIEMLECNVNALIADYVFEKLRYTVNTELLSEVETALNILTLYNKETGENVEAIRKHLLDRVKVNIYNDTLIPNNSTRDFTAAVLVCKEFGNLTKLALRPLLMVKEDTVGLAKIQSVILSGYFPNERLCLLSVAERESIFKDAYGLVYGERISNRWDFFKNNKNYALKSRFKLCNQINEKWRIANLDIGLVSNKTIADLYGFTRWFGNMMYASTTEPDWKNRLTIFIAKMMADGVFDALYVENDTLKYDFKKDKRFKVFNNYKENEQTIPENLRKQYAEEKGLYVALMQELISENAETYGLKLYYGNKDDNGIVTYSDLPTPYSTKDIISIKHQIGLLFGFYDRELKSLLLHTAGWRLTMLFKTFLPGEIEKWLAAPLETTVGKWEHLRDKDGNLLYYNSDLTLTTDMIAEDGSINRSVMEFVNMPFEGLVLSCLSTTALIIKYGYKNFKAEYPQVFANLIMTMIISLIITIGDQYLRVVKKEARELDSVLLAELFYFNAKVLNEFSFINTVWDSIKDLHLVGPGYLSDFIVLWWELLLDDNVSLIKPLFKTIGAAKDYQPLFDDKYIEDKLTDD